LCIFACGNICAQEYVISTYAGGPLAASPVPALNAAIGGPQALAADAKGNISSLLSAAFSSWTQTALSRALRGIRDKDIPAMEALPSTRSSASKMPATVGIQPALSLTRQAAYTLPIRRITARIAGRNHFHDRRRRQLRVFGRWRSRNQCPAGVSDRSGC
jgi:hypothetical protein